MPPDTELTARHPLITAWDDMPDDLKPVLEREWRSTRRLPRTPTTRSGAPRRRARGPRRAHEDTLIYYIVGDNGASAEAHVNGAFNEMANFNGMAAFETTEFVRSKMDEFGSPSSASHYSVGWRGR